MDASEHGRKLQARLTEKGVDRQLLAGIVGVDSRTVGNWTRGRTLPTLEMYLRLCDVLGDYLGDDSSGPGKEEERP